MSSQEVNPATYAAALQLAVPDFASTHPETWFLIYEVELRNRRVSDDLDKFYQLIPRLPVSLVHTLQPIIHNPPKENAYDALKAAILGELAPNLRDRLDGLFKSLRLGDQKPSLLLREMRTAAGPGGVSDELLRELWLARLPESLQVILASTPEQSLDGMASSADAVLGRMPNLRYCSGTSPIASMVSTELEVSRVAAPVASTSAAHENAPWKSEMEALRREIMNLTMSFRGRSRSRSRRFSSRGRQRSSSRSNLPPDSQTWCWYHQEYGTSAKNCRSPCSFNHKSGNG